MSNQSSSDAPVASERPARYIARGTAIVLAALGIVPVAQILSHGAALPWFGVIWPLWSLAIAVTLAAALALGAASGARGDRFGARIVHAVMAPSARAFVAACAAAALVLSAAAAAYCFHKQPQSIDEMAQLWHARILLSGHLWIPSEAHPEFFSAMNVIDAGGRWYSQFPIGGPLALAAGVAVGAAWLVNPVLCAVIVIATYRFARDAFGEALARGATLLLLVTPFFIFMSASQQNHVPTLALAMIALAALPSWERPPTGRSAHRRAAIIGAAIGAMATIRPLDAVAVAVPVGVFQLLVIARDPRRARELVTQIAAGLVPLGVLLWANAHTTGSPLRFGYVAMWGADHGLGFHRSPFGASHTPRRGLLLASLYLLKLDVYLFEWPVPAVLAPVIALFLVKRPTRWDAFLAGSIVSLLIAYALYWHNGHFLGPRFLFTMVPAFVILTARAPGAVAQHAGGVGRRAAYIAIPMLSALALTGVVPLVGVPERVAEYRDGQWELKANLAREVRAAHLTNALVFVHEGWGARLMARMWALGVERPDAERLLATSDACALDLAVAREAAAGVPDTVGLAARLAAATPAAARVLLRSRSDLSSDPTLLFGGERTLAPECDRENAADSAGVSLYPPFLALDRVGRDGRVGGGVVFVRDLGAHNDVLRDRFAGRTWYRYRPRRSPTDTSDPFVPY